MQMRVTLQSRLAQLQKTMRDHSQDVAQSQEQVSTGRRILRPSDDPVAVRHAMFQRARLVQLEQFISNAELAQIDVDAAESFLSQISSRVRRAVEIGMQMSNGVTGPRAMQAGADEVDQLINELLDLANGRFRGRYVFAGENVLEVPFVRNGDQIEYHGTDQGVLRRIRPANLPTDGGAVDTASFETTFSARGIFFEGDLAPNADGEPVVVQDGIFAALLDLKQALADGDQEAVSQRTAALRQEIDRIVQAQVRMGAQSEAIGSIREQMVVEKEETENARSQFEDADLGEVIADLQLRQLALQATLGITARMIPNTLLDFLFS